MEIITRYGVYCGRFNPIHAGHEAVINRMLFNHGAENCRLIIGSANSPQSLKHFFSYIERRSLIKTLFPDLTIMPLGDFLGNDDEWMIALDDILNSSGISFKNATFYGGCDEDISFFIKAGRTCRLVNRFDGTTPKISATEIRDSLIKGRKLDGFVNPLIEPMMKSMFSLKWMEFQSK